MTGAFQVKVTVIPSTRGFDPGNKNGFVLLSARIAAKPSFKVALLNSRVQVCDVTAYRSVKVSVPPGKSFLPVAGEGFGGTRSPAERASFGIFPRARRRAPPMAGFLRNLIAKPSNKAALSLEPNVFGIVSCEQLGETPSHAHTQHTYYIAHQALTDMWDGPGPWGLGPSPGLLDLAWVRTGPGTGPGLAWAQAQAPGALALIWAPC